jgi:hypothetical protein
MALLGLFMLLPYPALADAGLQLNPLKYQDTLVVGHVESGYVDVSNPGDTDVTVVTSVQGFRQADTDGDLEFYDDAALSAAITPGLGQFDLGPRGSIRMTFSVDSARLPRGGVYAALFFRTLPSTPQTNTSYVAESAKIGTLLILQNGPGGARNGLIVQAKLPFWQFGNGLTGGQLQYKNTDTMPGGIAFDPALQTQVLPWGRTTALTGPFIMPGATRQFSFARPGSYLGLLPVTITDTSSGKHVTVWVFACTGNYQLLVIGLVILAFLLLVGRRRGWLKRRRRPSAQRPLDGLSRKPPRRSTSAFR